MATIHPTLKWAQRTTKVFLTIELRDVKNMKIDLKPTTLSFSGDSDGKHYACEVEFFDEIIVEDSKQELLGYQVRMILMKKKTEDSHWPHLTKSGQKDKNIQANWDLWVDSDEEDDVKKVDDWNPDAMGGFDGGADSDDDNEVPDADLDDLKDDEELADVQPGEEEQKPTSEAVDDAAEKPVEKANE